jgi:hypothetical protein
MLYSNVAVATVFPRERTAFRGSRAGGPPLVLWLIEDFGEVARNAAAERRTTDRSVRPAGRDGQARFGLSSYSTAQPGLKHLNLSFLVTRQVPASGGFGFHRSRFARPSNREPIACDERRT